MIARKKIADHLKLSQKAKSLKKMKSFQGTARRFRSESTNSSMSSMRSAEGEKKPKRCAKRPFCMLRMF